MNYIQGQAVNQARIEQFFNQRTELVSNEKPSEMAKSLSELNTVICHLETLVTKLNERLQPILTQDPRVTKDQEACGPSSNVKLCQEINSFTQRACTVVTQLTRIEESLGL
jgi:hypothetical protein